MTNLEKYYDEIEEYIRAQNWGTACALHTAITHCGEKNLQCLSSVLSGCCLNKPDCLMSSLAWLKKEYKEPILDDIEREYLKGVIRPFKDDVVWISKNYEPNLEACFIRIWYSNGIADCYTDLPLFDDEDMYRGVEMGKQYTLEELDL